MGPGEGKGGEGVDGEEERVPSPSPPQLHSRLCLQGKLYLIVQQTDKEKHNEK